MGRAKEKLLPRGGAKEKLLGRNRKATGGKRKAVQGGAQEKLFGGESAATSNWAWKLQRETSQRDGPSIIKSQDSNTAVSKGALGNCFRRRAVSTCLR